MLTFGLVSSKVCITYSRCPCNKLWRCLECLNIQTIEVNRSSTKQLLNNFLGRFLEKLKQFSGRWSQVDCLLKKMCNRLELFIVVHIGAKRLLKRFAFSQK